MPGTRGQERSARTEGSRGDSTVTAAPLELGRSLSSLASVTPLAGRMRFHLRAGILAAIGLGIGLSALWMVCSAIENRRVDAVLARPLAVKDLGLAWQRAALRERDVLPL